MKTTIQSKSIRLCKIFGIPVITMLCFQILCMISGTTLFAIPEHFLSFVRTVAIVALTSFALSINLSSGRFDFSLGAMALLSSIIAAQISTSLHLPVGCMLLISAVVGVILGIISGLLYVSLQIPPIIISLATTLMFEGISYMFTNGRGISLATKARYISFVNNIWFILLIVFLSTVFITFLMGHTVFGYEHKALQSGQKIGVETGINEKKNAIISYAVAGMFMGIVGFLNALTQGTILVSLNFSSLSAMFVAFLPMFIGGFIGRWTNGQFGILLGAVTAAVITLGFVRLELSTQIQSLINSFVLLGFLLYLNNEGVIRKFLYKKKSSVKSLKNTD